jgi:hypothetical protein
MTNRILAYDERQTNKSWLDWLVKIVTPHSKTKKEKVLSSEELEQLEIIRKLQEENRIRRYALMAVPWVDLVSRKW